MAGPRETPPPPAAAAPRLPDPYPSLLTRLGWTFRLGLGEGLGGGGARVTEGTAGRMVKIIIF